MTQLNHINLGVSNVPELVRFFQAGFGFRIEETRGVGKFAVLLGEDGFVLILMHDKNVTDNTYPALFHVGFLVGSYEAVMEKHRRIVAAGFDAPAPAILERGGGKTFRSGVRGDGSAAVVRRGSRSESCSARRAVFITTSA